MGSPQPWQGPGIQDEEGGQEHKPAKQQVQFKPPLLPGTRRDTSAGGLQVTPSASGDICPAASAERGN